MRYSKHVATPNASYGSPIRSEGFRRPTNDPSDVHYTYDRLAVTVEEVRANFAKYGLLDDRVRFLEGWFSDTLPGPVEQLAVLRLDGDMYGSTWDALTALYPLVSPGGYVIVDDFALDGCRRAVHDFRAAHRDSAPIEKIDWTGVFWRKDHDAGASTSG